MQFVFFETTLDEEPFIKRWQQYTHSLNSNVDVTLQQSEKNGVFRYIAQHRLVSGELLFEFSKEARTSRVVQVQIKTTQAGGYSLLSAQRLTDTTKNECKAFVFVTDPRADLAVYKELAVPVKLNIYEAYYENCKYAYILEYFLKSKDQEALLMELKQYDIDGIEIYKECSLNKNLKTSTAKNFHVWPSF